jgi:hypothetical protein
LLLVEKDYAALWPLTDPVYRRWRAEAWIDGNSRHLLVQGRDRDALAADLATVGSTSYLWDGFAKKEIEQFGDAWSDVDLKMWGWLSRPRPHAPECEIVVLTPTGGVARRVEETTLLSGLQLVMHHTSEGWLVAGPLEGLAPAMRAA